MKTDYDAIVIGSGAGGLAAALTLSRFHVSVLLLEAMPSFGGYLNPYRRNGFTFDTGLHYLGKLGKGQTFQLLLKDIRLSDDVEFIELNPDEIDRYVFPDFELKLCKGQQRYMERLCCLFPQETDNIRKFFSIFDRIVDGISDPRAISGGWAAKLKHLIHNPVLLQYFRATYQKMLNKVGANRQLQAALGAHCGNSGLAPERASALLSVMLLDHYLTGAYYPQGGSAALRDAFVNALRRKGVNLKNRTPVVSIEHKANAFAVKTATQEQYTAHAVISNVNPSITLGQLIKPELLSRRIRHKALKLRPSSGSFFAFIGTDLDLPALGISDANIIHFASDDINTVFRTMNANTVPDPPPYMFITCPSLKDPQGGLAPPGFHTLQIITGLSYQVFEKWSGRPSRQRGNRYEAFKTAIGQRLIQAAEQYIPDLSNHLNFVEFATPLSSEYWVNAVKGGNFGAEQTPDQIGAGRFLNFSAGIDGLFLAGANTIAGGIQSCVSSGYIAGIKAAKYIRLR